VDVEIQVCFEESPDEQNIFHFKNYFCESTALPQPASQPASQPAQANKQKFVCQKHLFISKCENVKMT
jgi:hypothetical protein